MSPRRNGSIRFSLWTVLLASIVVPKAVNAQTFQPVPALSFTKVFAGANPLPQVVTIGRVGAAFNYSVAASTSTGGAWLTVIWGNGCGYCAAPSPIMVTVSPLVTLAAGSYTGQIVATSQSGGVTLTIPVTLIIAASGTPFIDTLQGQMNFSLKTGRTTATSQDIQIRNGGSGTLNWALTKSTSDGGDWLTISGSSGTAPAFVTVGINVANLPGAGLTQGTFVGQLVFSGGGTTVTVPVSVVVGDNILTQVNPISFTKVFGGADPLPQVLTIASTGTTFNYFIDTTGTASSTGGAWLTATTNTGCGYCAAPSMVTATINTSATLPVGSYTGQIVIVPQSGFMAITIPVTLTVAPAGGTFLDNFTGQMSFALKTAGTSITSQDLQIRNAGAGTLNWTVAGSTSDGGNWLTISAPSGTAPGFVTIGVTVANLPNGGLIAGTFVGELVFQTNGSAVTVPISVTVGDNIFSQVNSISFTKVFGGANPLPQTILIPSTGTTFNYFITSSTGNGGAWLTATTGNACGYCATPSTVIAKITASPTLPVGTYTGEIVVTSQGGTLAMTISVTLTVAPAGTAFFDNVPGQMSFSLQTGSNTNPPSQQLQIRNAGTGTLGWTLNPTTSDGGNWLNVSGGLSGTAPSILTLSIVKANLPGQGLIAGSFVGNLEFQSGGSSVTVSISVVVGDNVFSQVNPISFIKVYGGANPLPQTLTVASTGTTFNYAMSSSTANGGAWLTTATNTGCGYCATPSMVTATINAPPTLAVGTYTGQIVVISQASTLAITIPVTLTIVPASATHLDDLQGAMSFSFVTGSGSPPVQNIQVRNGRAGALTWKLTPSTSDGGNWLHVSASSGTAPAKVAISVVNANLPGLGLIAGTFTGQLLWEAAGASITVPVSVTVGANVFVQPAPLIFSKAVGGGNPLSQVLNIASSATNFNFTTASASATGGAWLTAATVGGCGYCATPHGVTVGISADPALPNGTYTGQIVLTAQNGLMSMTVPVTLIVGNGGNGTFTPGKLGIWRPGLFNMVSEDVDGNIAWDSPPDQANFFGATGDTVIFGDWDGSGKTKMGIFRITNGAAMFALDSNGNGAWDPGIDQFGFFGQPGDIPIVGDWTGDGKSKIGVYRPSTGLFALDVNGNLSFDGGVDRTGKFGTGGDTPIIGDWTGSGIFRVGTFNNGSWSLDVDNTLTISGGDSIGIFGQAGDTPLLGDWNGDGKTKVGIYRATGGIFGLDYNGNLAFDGADKGGVFGPGGAGIIPVVGDWDGTGVTRIGIFDNTTWGIWSLDMNGNIAWDAGTDMWGALGAAGDTPIVGKW